MKPTKRRITDKDRLDFLADKDGLRTCFWSVSGVWKATHGPMDYETEMTFRAAIDKAIRASRKAGRKYHGKIQDY